MFCDITTCKAHCQTYLDITRQPVSKPLKSPPKSLLSSSTGSPIQASLDFTLSSSRPSIVAIDSSRLSVPHPLAAEMNSMPSASI